MALPQAQDLAQEFTPDHPEPRIRMITEIPLHRPAGLEKGGGGSLATGAVHVLLYERAGLQGKVKEREMFREEQGCEGGILEVFGCPPPVCFCD